MLEQIADNLYVDPAAVVAVEVRFNDESFTAWEVLALHSGGAVSTIERFRTFGVCCPADGGEYEERERDAREAAARYTKWVNDRK